MKIFGTDFDGVIINIEPQKAKAFGAIVNKYWNFDSELARNFWLQKGGTARRYKFDSIYNQKYHSQLQDDIYLSIEQEYSHILKTKFYPTVKLLTGAEKLLKFIRTSYASSFVSSGVPMDELQYLIHHTGISHYFDLVLGTNQIYTSKVDHFKKVIQKYKPNRIVFVADSPEDMMVAKKNPSTIAIGVLTNHTYSDLKEAGADYIVDDLFQTLSVLKELN